MKNKGLITIDPRHNAWINGEVCVSINTLINEWEFRASDQSTTHIKNMILDVLEEDRSAIQLTWDKSALQELYNNGAIAHPSGGAFIPTPYGENKVYERLCNEALKDARDNHEGSFEVYVHKAKFCQAAKQKKKQIPEGLQYPLTESYESDEVETWRGKLMLVVEIIDYLTGAARNKLSGPERAKDVRNLLLKKGINYSVKKTAEINNFLTPNDKRPKGGRTSTNK